MAHFLCPRFCTEDTCLKVNLVAEPSLMNRFRKVCRVGRCAAQNGRLEICHELNLSVRIAGRHRQCQGSQHMGTAVETCSTGKESETVRDMYHIFLRCACSDERTRTALIPKANIILCVKCNDASACRSRRRLNSYTVFKRTCHKAVRICLA